MSTASLGHGSGEARNRVRRHEGESLSYEPLPGIREYAAAEASFLVGARPQDVVAAPLGQVLDVLERRHGAAIQDAVSAAAVDLDRPLADLPAAVASPRSGERDTSWMRRTNMVGVNVRTVGDYAGVVKYALTLPATIDSIHLLPIWEPGVVESLYGPASWNLNEEFLSEEWRRLVPHLDGAAKQLRALCNVLHVMGKAVGMDVIPHTDRFSEMATGTPDLFEWMRVADGRIVDQSESVVRAAEQAVFEWLRSRGSAVADLELPADAAALFSMTEEARLCLLFGEPADRLGRIDRRVDLVVHLHQAGLEPVPATMGVPFRGIEIDPDPAKVVVDRHGLAWPDYVIARPQPMSRVFSPLARYKLYGRLNDNADWEIDFTAVRTHVWEYVCRHYAAARHIGNFDFMRGDMSHVQMRPDGVPDVVDQHYDILSAVKTYIQRSARAPWFGYFAESFLPARDVFQFGEELDHLDASLADATLGDLQSTVVGSPEFLRRFRRYLDDLDTRSCAPAFTIGTSDKDDPRFDQFYRTGNEVRLFTALLVPDMPSYTGLGFEIRDVHDSPVENERYTKLFVFKEEGDSNVYPSKARLGDAYIWGENDDLFGNVTRIREYVDSVLPTIGGTTTRWLIPPDATTLRGIVCWTQRGSAATHVFVANYDVESESGFFGIPGLPPGSQLAFEFSTRGEIERRDRLLTSNGFFHRIEDLAPGEGRAYRVVFPVDAPA